MLDLAALGPEDFEPAIGTVFTVVLPGLDPLEIRLERVVRLPPNPGFRQAFSLRFEGPEAPVLTQVMHHLRHEELGDLELFLGPIHAPGPGVTYEAVFA